MRLRLITSSSTSNLVVVVVVVVHVGRLGKLSHVASVNHARNAGIWQDGISLAVIDQPAVEDLSEIQFADANLVRSGEL